MTKRVAKAVVTEYDNDGVKIGLSHFDVDEADNADYADDAGDDSADSDDGCRVCQLRDLTGSVIGAVTTVAPKRSAAASVANLQFSFQ